MRDEERKKFHILPTDLVGIDPLTARDWIIKCFAHAHNESFLLAKQTLGTSTDPEQVQKSIVATVKLAFQKTGHDFDNPSREAIVAVVESLASDSRTMGMPESIIRHHLAEIEKIINRLG